MPPEDFIPDGEFVPDAPPPGEVQPTSHAPKEMRPAAQQGAEPEFIPDSEFQSDEEKYGSPVQTGIALAEKFSQGLAGPLVPALERATGITTPEAMRMRSEVAGGLGTASELVGFGVGAYLGAGLPGVMGRLGIGAAKLAGLGEAATLGSKVAAGAVRGGAEMALLQGSEELTKLIEKDPKQTAVNAAVNMGLSTLLVGPGMGATFAAIPALWKASAGPHVEEVLGKIKRDWGFGNPAEGEEHIVSPVLKNLLSTFGGVSKENIEAYGANREAIRSAPEFMDLYGHVLSEMADIQENLAVKKMTVEKASNQFNTFLKEQKLALKQAGYDAGAADTMAHEALEQAQLRIAQGLQQGAVEAAPKIFSAVEKLKTQALEMSQGARDLLEQTPGELSLKPVFEALRPMQDKLYAQGFPNLAEELGKQMDVFAHQHGDRIAFADAKSMIQGLQQRGKWTFGANEVHNGLSSYFNQLSGIMNESLKAAVPAYRSAMKPTAAAFELLGKLDKYGAPESAVKGALGLKNVANYTNELPVLKSLEELTGVRFVSELEHYANPAAREAMMKALPEYGNALKTASALQELKNPEVRAALEKAPYLSADYTKLTKAEQALESAVERLQKYKGLTPATIEGKLKSVGAGKNLQAKSALEGLRGLPELEDLTIPELMRLIHIRESFEKGAMNGSRNVNLWSKMLGTLGGAIGALGGYGLEGTSVGAAGGAFLGSQFDKEGPGIVRKLLDKYLDRYGDLPKLMGGNKAATTAALVQFLDSGKAPNAAAFKAAVDYTSAARKGGELLKRGTKAIFESGKVLPKELYPDSEKTKKLDERSKKLNGPQAFYEGGGVGDYMPLHGEAIHQQTTRAVMAINQFRPQPQKLAFLDDEMEPTAEQEQEYHRGLQIAEQPLVTLHHIKENTLLPQDVHVLQMLHPEYYQHMSQELVTAMTDHVSKGGKVPYSLRQGLSLFLGKEVDSSLSPANIMAAQATFVNQRAQSESQVPKTTAKASASPALGKMSTAHQTQDAASQGRKQQLG